MPRPTAFTIQRVLELSTSHLTFEEAQGDAIGAIASMTCDYGWLFSTAPTVGVDKRQLPNLHAALELARSLGCDYLRLDSDGPVTTRLPHFDW